MFTILLADDNVAWDRHFGHRTGQYILTTNTILIGRFSGYYNQGSYNVFIGYYWTWK